jgi:hypothetical protein
MADITIYKNTENVDCVAWTDENGLEHSMLKSAYDTLVSNSSTPQAGN